MEFFLFAEGRTRTGTWLPTQDFESSTSTNFITSAYIQLSYLYNTKNILNFKYYFKNFLIVNNEMLLSD